MVPASDPAALLAEQAWALRSSDPAGAVALGSTLVGHTDDAVAARGGAALAYGYLRQGRLDLARAALGPARQRAERAGEAGARGRVHAVLGALELTEGHLPEAVRRMEQADAEFLRAGDGPGHAGVRVNLALAMRQLGDHARALELMGHAARQFRDLGDSYGEAVALVNTVQTWRELDDVETARPLAERAWEIARALDVPAFQTYVQATWGAVLAATGEPEQGQALLRAAAEEAASLGLPAVRCEALGSLALHLAERDPAAARTLLTPAMDAARASGEAWTVCRALLAIGEAAEAPAEARRAFEEAAALAATGLGLRARAHRGAARACEALGEAEAALEHYRRAAQADDQQAGADRAQRLARVALASQRDEVLAQGRAARRRVGELMAAARARAELVAMVAHDLRGPLTATMLMAESLREDVTEPRLREACRQILANQQRISRVIDALGVDMADEQGQAALTPQTEALELLVEAISAEHLPAARAKDQRLQLHARPVRLPVDAGRLFHAVANLIDNAIKYSPPGASLQVVVGPDDDGDGARIEVHDGGPGVDPLRAGALFQPYTRGEARPTGGERSTGLGLYIARRMVELHGGRLGVEPSRRTSGACFWVHLPRSTGQAAAQSQTSQDRTTPPSTPTKRAP